MADQRYSGQTPPFAPIIVQAVGDRYIDPARIRAIIWVGSTTAGDECILRCPETHRRLWRVRTPDTNTYMGVDFGDRGIAAPYGFEVIRHDAGANAELYIYITEA